MFWLFLWTLLWAAILFAVGALVGELARRMADEQGLTEGHTSRDRASGRLAGTSAGDTRTMTAPSPAARPVEREPIPAPSSGETEAAVRSAVPAPSKAPLMTPTVDEPVVGAGDTDEVAPERLAAPRNGVPDDLTRIRGIGKRNEERLHGLGIYHYEQIAGWKWEHEKWVESHLSFPGRIGREKWVDQARSLASKSTKGSTDSASGVSLN